MTKTFDQLIAEAQAALDALASHPEFATLLESGFWEPTISLSDAKFALDDLKDTNNYVQAILETCCGR